MLVATNGASTGFFTLTTTGDAVSGDAGSMTVTVGSTDSARRGGAFCLTSGSTSSGTGGNVGIVSGSSAGADGGLLLIASGFSSAADGSKTTLTIGVSSFTTGDVERLKFFQVTPRHWMEGMSQLPLAQKLANYLSSELSLTLTLTVSFVPKFKYLGTYLSQSLTEEADIDARILAATKNFNALGRSIFRNRKIPIELRSQLYLAITVNILLWGCDSWALKTTQLSRLSTFHHKCVRQLCGYAMYNVVKDYRIRTETCLEKIKLKPIEKIITVRQLRFLSRIAQMDESRLTRQVMSSQGIISGGSRAGRNKLLRWHSETL
eukprot:scaffold2946_cov278-Chaetoceros_neogracile.AAC.1